MTNYGYDSYLGLKKEGTWGTYEGIYGANSMFVPLIKENFVTDIAWVDRKSELRQSRFPATPIPGRKSLTGGFTINGYPNAMGMLWATLLGDADSDNLLAPGIYSHIFIASSTVSRQLSAQVRKGAADPRNISGFVIDEIKLAQDNEGLLQVEITGAGKDGVAGTSDTAVYVETMPFIFYNAIVELDGTPRCLDSVEFSFKQNRKLENWKICGNNQTILEPPFTDRPLFEGTMTLDFEDWADYDEFAAFSDLTLKAEWVSTEEVVPASGQYYTMTIECPLIRLKNPTPVVDKPGLLTMTIPFECTFADTIDGNFTPLQVTIIDATASH